MVADWLMHRTDERTGFYSAQEDQNVPQRKATATASNPPGKKPAQAKRITNNMITEQLTALSAQLQLLSQRHDHLEKAGQTFVPSVPGPFFGPTSKLPPVSAGLPIQARFLRQ